MPRPCTCPADGSRYCAWCQALLARATSAPKSGSKERRARASTPILDPGDVTLPGVLLADSPPRPRYRSQTEHRYAILLEQWQHDGQIHRWRYEALRLHLAPSLTFTADFVVTLPQGSGDGRLQLHEVKARWGREDGWIKLKMAAAAWPEFRFILAREVDRQWCWREVPVA